MGFVFFIVFFSYFLNVVQRTRTASNEELLGKFSYDLRGKKQIYEKKEATYRTHVETCIRKRET